LDTVRLKLTPTQLTRLLGQTEKHRLFLELSSGLRAIPLAKHRIQ
jgi:hypothetical protein